MYLQVVYQQVTLLLTGGELILQLMVDVSLLSPSCFPLSRHFRQLRYMKGTYISNVFSQLRRLVCIIVRNVSLHTNAKHGIFSNLKLKFTQPV